MRDDQRSRVEELANELIDVVIEEADPKLWPGAGKPLADLQQQERGDRYWCKKNAAATLVLAVKIQSLIEKIDRPDWKDDEKDIDEQITAAQREAEKRLETISKHIQRNTH